MHCCLASCFVPHQSFSFRPFHDIKSAASSSSVSNLTPVGFNSDARIDGTIMPVLGTGKTGEACRVKRAGNGCPFLSTQGTNLWRIVQSGEAFAMQFLHSVVHPSHKDELSWSDEWEDLGQSNVGHVEWRRRILVLVVLLALVVFSGCWSGMSG